MIFVFLFVCFGVLGSGCFSGFFLGGGMGGKCCSGFLPFVKPSKYFIGLVSKKYTSAKTAYEKTTEKKIYHPVHAICP